MQSRNRRWLQYGRWFPISSLYRNLRAVFCGPGVLFHHILGTGVKYFMDSGFQITTVSKPCVPKKLHEGFQKSQFGNLRPTSTGHRFPSLLPKSFGRRSPPYGGPGCGFAHVAWVGNRRRNEILLKRKRALQNPRRRQPVRSQLTLQKMRK